MEKKILVEKAKKKKGKAVTYIVTNIFLKLAIKMTLHQYLLSEAEIKVIHNVFKL